LLRENSFQPGSRELTMDAVAHIAACWTQWTAALTDWRSRPSGRLPGAESGTGVGHSACGPTVTSQSW
jgi:hypothetical protein